MTKLDWARAGRYEPDPGAVVGVSDTGVRPVDDDHPFITPSQRAKKAAKERLELLARSEKKRLKALAKKKARLATIASGKYSRE